MTKLEKLQNLFVLDSLEGLLLWKHIHDLQPIAKVATN